MLLGCPGVVQRLSEVARGMLSEAFGSCRKLSEAVTSIPEVSQRYPSFAQEELPCQWNAIQINPRSIPEVSHQVSKFRCSETSKSILFQLNFRNWWSYETTESEAVRRCPDAVQRVFGGVWQLLTASDSLWDTFGILLTASDSFRQLLTTFGQPMTTSDSLWAPSGQPLDSGQRLTTINF